MKRWEEKVERKKVIMDYCTIKVSLNVDSWLNSFQRAFLFFICSRCSMYPLGIESLERNKRNVFISSFSSSLPPRFGCKTIEYNVYVDIRRNEAFHLKSLSLVSLRIKYEEFRTLYPLYSVSQNIHNVVWQTRAFECVWGELVDVFVCVYVCWRVIK